MDLTTFSSWNKTLASIVASGLNPHSIEKLLRSLEQLVNGCNSMSILYPKGQQAIITHNRLRADEDQEFQIGEYVNGAFLLDPFYRKTKERDAEGIHSLESVIPDGFEKSEYYNIYYKQANLIDEVCFVFLLKKDLVASLSICRSNANGERRFSKNEIELLKATFPIVKYIVSQWVHSTMDVESSTLGSHLDSAMANFGNSLLTQKECDVLQHVLHGYSIKSIAEKLGNSIETIKYHRKNFYGKLDIKSQPELFHLFIDSLRHYPAGIGGDPLQYYFEKDG